MQVSVEVIHVAIALGSALFGGVGGLVAGVWRVARVHTDLRREITKEISEAMKALEEKVDHTVTQFDETLKGLRQKINDVELDTARSYVVREDFDDFRKEYREDMRDLKHSLAELKK